MKTLLIIAALFPVTLMAQTIRTEAESFSASIGVQTETTRDAGGGLNVGWIDKGDWMEYKINTPAAGTYKLNVRIASVPGGQFQIKNAAGVVLATLDVPKTGDYQTWVTIASSVTLPAGAQTVRLLSTSAAIWNINWFELVYTAPVYEEVEDSIVIYNMPLRTLQIIYADSTKSAIISLPKPPIRQVKP